jgi:hypothetical protein
MFSRCASGSCDFVLFSVDDRAWIVEDIVLGRALDAFACNKLDSLAKGLELDGIMLEKGKYLKAFSKII